MRESIISGSSLAVSGAAAPEKQRDGGSVRGKRTSAGGSEPSSRWSGDGSRRLGPSVGGSSGLGQPVEDGRREEMDSPNIPLSLFLNFYSNKDGSSWFHLIGSIYTTISALWWPNVLPSLVIFYLVP